VNIKKITWMLPGVLIGFVIYLQFFLQLPQESIFNRRPQDFTGNIEEQIVPTFYVAPMHHYRIDAGTLLLFQERDILTYGRPNPMLFEPPKPRALPPILNDAPHTEGIVENENIRDAFERHSVLPVAKEYFNLSSNFGWREDPFSGEFVMHNGIDIAARNSEGESIILGKNAYAVLGGTIEFAGEDDAGGLMVIINHGEYETYYAHLQEMVVDVGDVVRPGQIIGRVGNTGRSTGPHLHFEIHISGTPVDPMDYLITHFRDAPPPTLPEDPQ